MVGIEGWARLWLLVVGMGALELAGCAGNSGGDDECSPVSCENGGTPNGCDTCTCATGFEGTRCETKSTARLVGNYAANTTWTSTDSSSGDWANAGGTLITESMSFGDRIQVSLAGHTSYGGSTPYGCTNTVGNVGNRFAFYAVIAGNQITLPTQLADAYISINGNGTIMATGSSLVLDLTFTGSSSSQLQSCMTTWSISLSKL